MSQQHRFVLLCLALALSSMACAPKLVGPTDAGYFVSVQVLPPTIYLRRAYSSYLLPELQGMADVVVHVQDAQGAPVNGVPVAFEMAPATAPVGALTPTRVLTSAGDARAVFRPTTIGLARLLVRVDSLTQRASLLVDRFPSGGGGAASGGR